MKEINSRDILFFIPDKYEKRRILKKEFFKQDNLYVFQASIYKCLEHLNDKIMVIAYVFQKQIRIIDDMQNREYYPIGKKIFLCGKLKFWSKDRKDMFCDDYDMQLSNKEEENSFLQDEYAAFDINDNCRWNRNWTESFSKIRCVRPSFDARTGIVPISNKIISYKEIIDHIVKNAPRGIVSSLLEIHEPDSFEDLNDSLKNLFALEVACFLKCISRSATTEPMPINPTYKLNITLTASQEISLKEIYKDLDSSIKMNRVLYGDVGSGKTIVAILAALKCITNGKNVLYLVPTQLLAKQVHDQFKKFTPQLEIFLFLKEYKKEFSQQKAAIFVGTHALLWKTFENIGLVIIDEQHKFGVEQREKVAQDNNLLMMTATAIPRTLQLMLLGNIDVSKLNPQEKLPIQTIVKCSLLIEEIRDEIINMSDQKVIWVTKSIKKTEENYNLFKERMNANAKLFILHGKIKEKHRILEEFQQKGGILFATTVIEVGIDIDLNYIVIEDADQFGLAQLHQIRGRVGRRNRQGTCILIGSDLAFLQKIEKCASGEEISQLDLRKRGHGVLHSNNQAGFDHFIFNKQWKNKKWQQIEINEEICEKVKKIKLDHEKHREVLDLFVESKIHI